jgi:hypothetical protein
VLVVFNKGFENVKLFCFVVVKLLKLFDNPDIDKYVDVHAICMTIEPSWEKVYSIQSSILHE